jgi:adenylyl-sulfate kinase
MDGLMSAPAGGFAVWLTGLPSSGKTTIAGLLVSELERRGLTVESLDGDVVRTHLSKDLGYSRADRDTNIARLGWVASRLVRHGAPVVVAAISPYREARANVRAQVEEQGAFVEVWVNASVAACQERDVKGLYARAAAGEITGMTGVDDPYEAPEQSEITIDTVALEPSESVGLVLAYLERIGAISAAGAAQ